VKKEIEFAVNANITVYDFDAQPGILTPRLIKLIKSVHRKLYKENVKYIYIDYPIKLSNCPCWLENQLKLQYKVVVHLTEHVLKYNCVLGSNKKYFILAVGDKNTTLGMC